MKSSLHDPRGRHVTSDSLQLIGSKPISTHLLEPHPTPETAFAMVTNDFHVVGSKDFSVLIFDFCDPPSLSWFSPYLTTNSHSSVRSSYPYYQLGIPYGAYRFPFLLLLYQHCLIEICVRMEIPKYALTYAAAAS